MVGTTGQIGGFGGNAGGGTPWWRNFGGITPWGAAEFGAGAFGPPGSSFGVGAFKGAMDAFRGDQTYSQNKTSDSIGQQIFNALKGGLGGLGERVGNWAFGNPFADHGTAQMGKTGAGQAWTPPAGMPFPTSSAPVGGPDTGQSGNFGYTGQKGSLPYTFQSGGGPQGTGFTNFASGGFDPGFGAGNSGPGFLMNVMSALGLGGLFSNPSSGFQTGAMQPMGDFSDAGQASKGGF